MILNIAELSVRIGGPVPLDDLRPLYPELAFLFDYVDVSETSAAEAADAARAEARDEADALQDEINELERRVLELRNAALQIAHVAMLLPGKGHAEAQDLLSHINEIVKEDLS